MATILLGLTGLGGGTLGADAARHEVAGKGRLVGGESYFTFEIEAWGGPSDANGSVRLVEFYHGNAGPATVGKVSCLKVRGHRTVVAGQVTEGPGVGTYFALWAEDDGRNRRRPKDQLGWDVGGAQPVSCPLFNLGDMLSFTPLARGDITIS
jgi:hypothetical protein